MEQTPDGTCIRDYIHVADLAAAHLMVLQALESHDKLIYNLATIQTLKLPGTNQQRVMQAGEANEKP